MSRQTIGENPLDQSSGMAAYLTSNKSKTSKKTTTSTVSTKKSAEKVSKVLTTFRLPETLADEIRSAVVALSGPPERLTMSAFAEQALIAHLEKIKKEHNKGKPFPKLEGKLVGGRPIGS